MIQAAEGQDGQLDFTIPTVAKGLWSNRSILSMAPGFVPGISNFDLDGGIPTSMKGDADMFLDDAGSPAGVAWPNDGGTVNLLTYHRSATGTTTYILGTTAGIIYYWIGGATHTWTILRQGLSTTATLWWAPQRYGTDLYISNPTDGIFRYDGTNLIPVGAKSIATCESGEAADWTNETANTTDFRQGTQGMYVDSGNGAAGSVLKYDPSAVMDTLNGRGSAKQYSLLKASAVDCYHMFIKMEVISGAGTLDTANTKIVFTDTAAKSLTFPFSTWKITKSITGTAADAAVNTFQEIFLWPTLATEVATFNPLILDKIELTVATNGGAGVRRMTIDDIYCLYGTTMPACNYLGEWRNMLFGAIPGTIYFSPENAPDEYNTLASLNIKSNGDLITGLKNFYNQLTITTETQVHTISGTVGSFAYPGYLFDINMVTDEIGCSSHRSIVKAAEKLYWWYNNSIAEYDGTNGRKISSPIDYSLLTLINSRKQFIVAAPFRIKNQIFWTYTATGATNNAVLRYDYVLGAFLETAGLITPLITQVYDGADEYLLTCNTTTRLVKKQGQTGVYTFSGTSIDYSLTLPPMLLPGVALEWNTAEIFYLDNTGSLVAGFRISEHLRDLSAASYSTAETINMANAGEYGKIRFGDRARFFQLKLTATAALVEIEFPLTVKAITLGALHNRVTP
jgi:hypothetical protein